MRENVDSLVIIPNERLKFVSDQKITFKNAFAIADDVLRQAVANISELITVPGFINLDFADVTSVMKDAGFAHIGTGAATGKDKATEAAQMAISSPLLETSIDNARGIILSISALRTSASRRSRPQLAWCRRRRIRMRTSSSAPPSTRSSTMSCALWSSQPDLTRCRSRPRARTARSSRPSMRALPPRPTAAHSSRAAASSPPFRSQQQAQPQQQPQQSQADMEDDAFKAIIDIFNHNN